MKAPVVISTDVSLIMHMTVHNYYGAATGYSAPALGACIESICVNMWWPPGALTGDHKLASTVQHRSLRTVQVGHKLGPLVPHVEMVPASDDILTPVQMLTSSFEVKFQNGEIVDQGAPIGVLMPLTPALVCTDLVSLPCGYSPSAIFNSAWLDVSWVDIVAGWVEIVVTMVVDFLAYKAKGGGGFAKPQGGPRPSDRVIDDQRVDALRPDAIGMGASVQGGLLSSLAGAAVRSVGREYFGYNGPITVGTSASAGILGSSGAQFTSNRDGSWNVAPEVRGPLGLTSAQGQFGSDADGNLAGQAGVRGGPFGAQGTLAETTGPGGERQVVRQGSLSEGAFGTSSESAPVPVDWL